MHSVNMQLVSIATSYGSYNLVFCQPSSHDVMSLHSAESAVLQFLKHKIWRILVLTLDLDYPRVKVDG